MNAVPKPNPTGDCITVLTSAGPRLTKVWESATGKPQGYEKAQQVAVQERHVDGIRELSALLTELESERNSCIIRGGFIGHAKAKELYPQEIEQDRKRGKSLAMPKEGFTLRRLTFFNDQPLHFFYIDSDKYVPEGIDPVIDPEGAINQYITLHLPVCFQGITFHWQLSSGAGHPDNVGVLKAHVAFWLSKPHLGEDLDVWVKAKNLPIDVTVFRTVQPNYTAAPVFVNGVIDPVPVRSGLCEGMLGDEVDLVIEPTILLRAKTERKSRLEMVDPRDKDNLIGLFCRTFEIEEVVENWLPDVFEFVTDTRLTWLHSTSGATEGAGVTDNRQGIFNTHNGDPFAGRAANKWDLVRHYKFGHLDQGVDALELVDISNRPSHLAMRDFVNSLPEIRATQTADSRVDRTDAGNLAILDRHAQGNLRYVPELKRWYGWDGQRWVADPTGPTSAQGFAFQVGEYYYAEAAKVREQLANESLDAAGRRRIERAVQSSEAWAAQCRNKSRIDNMLGLAKCDGRFMLPFEALDRDPWLFGVENGVVDLRTGQLRSVGRDDFVTLRSPVAFNPGAKAPRWCQFIDEVTSHPNTGKRADLAAYLQRALGYSLTGSTAEHKMFMAIGAGANGKNVLLDMLQWLLPGYCETIAPEALMSSKHDSDAERPTPSMRKLAGARMAISSESKDGQKLDVALVKRHTGGGYITARGLHENAFRFEITHKLWLMTNHKPALDNIDDAVRGRLHMIPFDMRWNRPGHPERNPSLPDGDKQLPAKLREEAQGVLAWLIEGAVAYHREGLEPPEEVARMTRSYFADQDPLTKWLQNFEKCPPEPGIGAAELYTAFCDWCMAESARAMTNTAFGLRLGELGIESRKTRTVRVYGLRQVTSTDDFLA